MLIVDVKVIIPYPSFHLNNARAGCFIAVKTKFYRIFLKNSFIYIGEDYEKQCVKSYRIHNGFMLLSLKDLEDINLVEKYKNRFIYKSSDDIKPLDDGYYFRDLKGLDVYVEDKLVGKVMYAEEGIRNDYLRIKKLDDKEALVPIIDNFVLNIDLDNNRVDIVKMEGLL